MRPVHDLSTLDPAKLAALPLLGELTRGYHLQRDPGAGCFLDPPGFPSYFTRAVYTASGADPGRGPTTVIDSPEGPRVLYTAETAWLRGETHEAMAARHAAGLRALYRPLPEDHPRVQAWRAAVHGHLTTCYIDDAGLAEPAEYGRPALIIFPTPSYKLRDFHDDARFSDTWRAAERAAVDAYNRDKIAAYTRVATLDNHAAVRHIREFYPSYAPTAESIEADRLRARAAGDWWERYAVRPTPAQCAPPAFLGEHRSVGWCQFCGAVDGVQEVTP